MKSLKTAALVAGSVVLAGAATPAFAQDGSGTTPAGLTGTVKQIAGGPVQVRPVKQALNGLDSGGKGSSPVNLKGATDSITQRTGGRLLGGLPLQN
ncbi:hypothetical protein [Streptomyces anandii]|uniref:ATP-binding protein n=1 Tax=Streptomyces anandii TaxID=285454 RepID=A0ABW6HAG5_9ACTN